MNISVTEPVSLAIERMKQMLFRPFDFAKWVYLGFTAWLAQLTEGGGGNFRLPSNLSDLNDGGGDKSSGLDAFPDFIPGLEQMDLPLVVGLTIGTLLVVLVLTLLFTWLSSRGRFMFLDNAIRDRAEVKKPWREYREQGNSLFIWRYFFGLFTFFLFLILIGAVVIGFLQQTDSLPSFVSRAVKLPLISRTGLITLIVVSSLLFFVALYIYLFLDDFIVPLMAGYGLKTNAAWSKFLVLFRAHKGGFLFYGLFKAILAMGVGVMLVIGIILTCCLAGCLIVIPVVGSIFLLPVSLSFRLYSVYYLAQYGSDYDLFTLPARDGGEGSFYKSGSRSPDEVPPADMTDNPYYPYR